MNNTVSLGSVIALFVVAMGSSITVFSTASTPAKIAMFAIGLMAGILLGRFISQQSASNV